MEINEKFKLISLDVFIEYVVDKKVNITCSLCSNVHLSVPQVQIMRVIDSEPTLTHCVNVFVDKSIHSDSADRYYISLVCTNCGKTTQFDANAVLDWAVAKGKIEQTGDENE